MWLEMHWDGVGAWGGAGFMSLFLQLILTVYAVAMQHGTFYWAFMEFYWVLWSFYQTCAPCAHLHSFYLVVLLEIVFSFPWSRLNILGSSSKTNSNYKNAIEMKYLFFRTGVEIDQMLYKSISKIQYIFTGWNFILCWPGKNKRC